MEVVAAEKNLLDPDHADNHTAFKNWLQCYGVPGMSSLRDHNGRTIWFQGEPGPMAPRGECPLLPAGPAPALGGLEHGEEEEAHSQALLGRQLLPLLGHSGLWLWGMQPAVSLASSQHLQGAFPGLQPRPVLT